MIFLLHSWGSRAWRLIKLSVDDISPQIFQKALVKEYTSNFKKDPLYDLKLYSFIKTFWKPWVMHGFIYTLLFTMIPRTWACNSHPGSIPAAVLLGCFCKLGNPFVGALVISVPYYLRSMLGPPPNSHI